MTHKTVTKTKRGFFGWIFLALFWAFQALMIFAIFANFGAAGDVGASCDGGAACEAGVAIGAGMGAVVGWFVWMLGTIVLGLATLMTRGKMVSITVEKK